METVHIKINNVPYEVAAGSTILEAAHSVGIEIHEAPNANMRDETLMPVGAAVSAEPGIYLPGRFGVRIEDVAIMTEDGCIDITKAPKELIVL